MVVFRVTENVNIKTTDGTLVKYSKLRNPSNLLNNSLYITTYADKQKLDGVLKKVGEEYQAKVLKESKVNGLNAFPKELGVSNKYEYTTILNFEQNFNEHQLFAPEHRKSFLNEQFVCLEKQLDGFDEDEIKIVLLGNLGEHIGETIASLTALRIFHGQLLKRFKSVILDIYIEASENSFFTRDRDILKTQNYISNIYPLSISVQKFCEYDFYIDNSSIKKQYFYQELNYVDSFLYKFGIDYKQIAGHLKHNILDVSALSIRNDLKEKIQTLKAHRKLLLFHPYSSHSNRSFPKEEAKKFLEKLIKKCDDYTIVSALHIDDIKADNYVNLTAYSKTINEFIYLISSVDKIITTDTATYHIADAFFIPTVVFFTEQSHEKRATYYQFVQPIQIKDKSKNFSKFKFENDALVLHKFESWKSIKYKEVMKLLETI